MINSETKADLIQLPKPQEKDCGFFAFGEGIRFRPMTTADMDEIMVVERSAYRFPWSQGFFLEELQVACARSILAELDGKIIGYVLFWLLPGTVDIHNLATHVNYRRHGVARLLLSRVLGHAREHSVGRVTLEVRKSNLPAQKLYESMGFVTNGIRKGYYSDDGEDALAMSLELPSQG